MYDAKKHTARALVAKVAAIIDTIALEWRTDATTVVTPKFIWPTA